MYNMLRQRSRTCRMQLLLPLELPLPHLGLEAAPFSVPVLLLRLVFYPPGFPNFPNGALAHKRFRCLQPRLRLAQQANTRKEGGESGELLKPMCLLHQASATRRARFAQTDVLWHLPLRLRLRLLKARPLQFSDGRISLARACSNPDPLPPPPRGLVARCSIVPTFVNRLKTESNHACTTSGLRLTVLLSVNEDDMACRCDRSFGLALALAARRRRRCRIDDDTHLRKFFDFCQFCCSVPFR